MYSEDSSPIESYLEITSLTDKSDSWNSRVGDIDSFKSVNYKRSCKTTSIIPQLPARKLDSVRQFNSLNSNLNLSLNSSIATPPSKDNNAATLPTAIHIEMPDDVASLANQKTSAIKLTSMAEINQDMDTANATAINGIKQDYTTILSSWDKTKAALDAETKLALKDIQNVLGNSSQASEHIIHANKSLNDTKLDIKKTRETIE